MNSELSEARAQTAEIRDRVRGLLQEMKAVEFKPPDDDSSEPVDVLAMPVADEWVELNLWGRYSGQIKRISNGNNALRVVWRWGRLDDGSLPEHRHPHNELFVVTHGKVRFTVRGQEHTYRVGDTRLTRTDEPHEMTWCSPDCELFIFWWRDE